MRDMKMRHQIARVENATHENAGHDKAGKANARPENNASKAVMGSCQMYKFGSLRQLCLKNSDN